MKILQVGLGEILRKLSITISKSTQNLRSVSKLQNLSVKGFNSGVQEYLTYVVMDLTWFCFENELVLQYGRNDTNLS